MQKPRYPFKKRKNSRLTDASDVLQGLFQNGKSALSDQFLRWQLWRHWSEIAGETMAQQSEPVGLYRKTLYVWVKHPVWIQQFQFMSGELIQDINKAMGRDWIAKIRFTLDRKSVPESAKTEVDRFSDPLSGSPSEGEAPQRGQWRRRDR